MPQARKMGLEWFEAIGNHNRWDATIKRVFEVRNIASWNQKVYILQKQDYKGKDSITIDQCYSVVKINETLYNDYDYSIKNIGFLNAKILEFWSSIYYAQ